MRASVPSPRRRWLLAGLALGLLALGSLLGRGEGPPPAAGPVPVAAAPATDRTTAGTGTPPAANDRLAAAAAPAPTAVAADAPAEGEPFAVVVHDPRGAAVPGCRVAVGDQQATSGADGAAHFAVLPGRPPVEVTPPAGSGLRAVRGRQNVGHGAPSRVTVVLPRVAESLCWCQLVAAETGAPLRTATVHSQPSGQRLEVDAEGFVAVPWGGADSHADVALAGRGPRRIVPQGGHDDRRSALRVALALGVQLTVAVADEAGAPIAGCTVTLRTGAWQLQCPEDSPSTGPAWQVALTTDLHGLATAADLPAGLALEATVAAPAPFAAPRPQRWRLQAPAERRDLVLLAGASLRGLVQVDGAPGAGARVRLAPALGDAIPPVVARGEHTVDVVADRDGAFACTGLAAGAYDVGLVDSTAWGEPVRVVCAPLTTAAVTLQARAGGELRGTVVRDDGAPEPGCWVAAEVGEAPVGGARSDAAGAFVLRGLPPGPLLVRVEGEWEREYGLAAPVAARAGGPPVVLRLQPMRATITGRLATADGAAWVTSHRRDLGTAIGCMVDLDGAFWHRGLEPGLWDLTAHDGHGGIAWLGGLQLGPGQRLDVGTLHLQPGSAIAVRHPQADEYVACRGDQVLARDNLLDGATSRAHVPAGEVTVVFRKDDREIARRTIAVAPGATVAVDG